MIEKRDLWLVGLAGFLAVVVSVHFYDAGKREVVLKATEDSLVVVRKEKAVIQKQRDSVGAALAVQGKKSAETHTVYVHDTVATRIVGDTAFDSTGAVIQVLDPRISKRIKDTDTHVTSLEAELRTAKFALRVDTVFIAKQDQETGLNERVASLTKGSRISRGIQLGVGYCATQYGNTPCAFVGYGLQVRLP